MKCPARSCLNHKDSVYKVSCQCLKKFYHRSSLRIVCLWLRVELPIGGCRRTGGSRIEVKRCRGKATSAHWSVTRLAGRRPGLRPRMSIGVARARRRTFASALRACALSVPLALSPSYPALTGEAGSRSTGDPSRTPSDGSGPQARVPCQRADARQANTSWTLVVCVQQRRCVRQATRAMTHLRYSPSRQLALTG
jgi:hypothetical protein